jgi:hypothetical protein
VAHSCHWSPRQTALRSAIMLYIVCPDREAERVAWTREQGTWPGTTQGLRRSEARGVTVLAHPIRGRDGR